MSSSKTPEYCGKRQNTLHSRTRDLVFRCCGERVPNHLSSSTSLSSTRTSTITTKGKGKKIVPTPQATIIISSPIGSTYEHIPIKIGQSQFTNREIVELYRKGSITKSAIEKKSKQSSEYGLIPSLLIPGRETSDLKRVIPARDSQKIVVLVGSSSDKWSSFKNLGN